jgi:hypothetical protein
MDESRRRFLAAGAGGFLGFALRNGAFARENKRPVFSHAARAMIVLWMDGGPSQIDTFDPRPGRKTGGPVRAIETSAPELRFSSLLPRTSRWAHRMSVLRTVVSPENEHDRGSYLLRTGFGSTGRIVHPALGSLIAFHNGSPAGIPSFVSIRTTGTLGTAGDAGFLGAEVAPFPVLDPARAHELMKGLDGTVEDRLNLVQNLNADFSADRSGEPIDRRKAFLSLCRKLKDSPFARALDLRDEAPEVVQEYGADRFGTGCLLARRLVESGVRFVEVELGGWDTHSDNYREVSARCAVLDPAMSALYRDLDRRGLLEETVVVWMGEFGRTPDLNAQQGRDHWSEGFTVVVGGAGVGGGRAIGELDADGKAILKDPVKVPDVMATLLTLMRIDPRQRHRTSSGGADRITDQGRPLRAVLD